jgi:hypothetical protein
VSAGSEQTEPATPVPSTPPSAAATPAMPSMAAFGSNESCPNCNARMALDQRYCLNCGHRRGEPRLPFMDAVVFMESMNQPGGGAGTPPPPPAQQSGGSNNIWNANAALITGVAALVLAIGVGFLIGRTGHNDNSSAGNGGGPVRVVQIGGAPATGGGVPEEAVATPEGASAGETGRQTKSDGAATKSSGQATAKKKASDVKEGSPEEKELAKEKTKEVLHTAGNVELAEPEQEIGGACQEGQAGCEGGKFKGNFFE